MPPPPQTSSPLYSPKPETDPDSQKCLPPNYSIAPITASTLPAYRRLITLLLPIRYPDKFYEDSAANPTTSSLALCALWPEIPRPGKRTIDSPDDRLSPSLPDINNSGAKVVGGIQCRLEPLPCPPPTASQPSLPAPSSSNQQPYNLYIQTLAVLSPYRSLGIATALLDAIISTALTHYLRLDINMKEIYAHVWEANEEALEWYMKRGFEIGAEVVKGYYRKLRPSGARVVRRRIGVGDWVGASKGWKVDSKDSGEDVKQYQYQRDRVVQEVGSGGG